MIKLNPKYEALFQNDTRFFIITGGRGSAKSFGVGSFATALSFEEGHKILFTRQTMTSAHLSIIPEFQEKIDLMEAGDQFTINKTEIVNKASGSEIVFRGIKTSSGDQTANLKSLQGVTTWIVDEAEELTDEKTFDKINLSIRQKGKQNRVILILNPATKEHWIYKRFFESEGVNPGFNGIKGNVTYIHTDYRDNAKHLDDSFLQEVDRIKTTNPKKYEHQILGGWLDKAEGVILTNWTIGEFKEVGKVVYGQDYGFSVDPTTLVKTSIDKARKKIYVKELLYKPNLVTSEIAAINLRECGKDLIYGDSAEPRLIAELRERGCNIEEAVKGQGSITAGIAMLQDFEIIVDPESINLIKELNNYVWNDKKSGTPVDDYNHCFVGDTLISTPNGQVPIRDIKEGDLVCTPNGDRKVLIKWDNGLKHVENYVMQFDTFSVYLSCTEDHLVKTDSGWIAIKDVTSNQKLYLHKSLTGLHSDYTRENGISQGELNECTSMSGNFTTDPSQKDFMFTIRTKTPSITASKISNSRRRINILANTVKGGMLRTRNGQKHSMPRGLRKPKNGMQAQRVLNGTRRKLLNTVSGNLICRNVSANNVSGYLSQKRIIASSVPITVNRNGEEMRALTTKLGSAHTVEKTLLSINTVKRKHAQRDMQQVYDLMVENDHCYYANGVLVHNCVDALRYAIYSQLVNTFEFYVN